MKIPFSAEKKILIAFVLIFMVHVSFNYHRIKIDGAGVEVYSILFSEDTSYSKDFSHNNFRKIKIGMREKEVYKLLGQPLSKFAYQWVDDKTYNEGRFVGLKYSESENSKDYRLRIIHMDKGIVVRIMGEFYFD